MLDYQRVRRKDYLVKRKKVVVKAVRVEKLPPPPRGEWPAHMRLD
jgi:hypothetical protein